ncbi:unnamed protein product [Didymodactylos carnosus]|uniref:G domain-containing protein n=1 Tax=Didymodactylos carnosus TaxID=1234261 RepID=A0A814QM89_9BILA|nr:unnamed protein product [Didymodactylos carnosus]CAF1120315.1 unnamed protein product [Didymodactylos carnosus]CAF3578529.1 unnamed protein product [Didymodactylos carnosus]CAF3883947.1 unnamed protein product [Didymodactylos carnosus]
MNKRIPQLVAREDEPSTENSESLNYLKQKLLEIRRRDYDSTAIADAKAIQKISAEFEILVFGPARVGKSALIKALSGDANIQTSLGLNACTTMSERYVDQFGVCWWDTPGIEQWQESDAKAFLHDKFYVRRIMPRAALFCRSPGALGNLSVVRYMFNELEKHGVVLFIVLTRWPFLPNREQVGIVEEAVQILGGEAQGIYPVQITSPITTVEVIPKQSSIFCSRSKEIPSQQQSTLVASEQKYRAIECRANSSYIVPVNSHSDTNNNGETIPALNVNLLRQLIILKTAQGNSNDEKLIDLYKNQISLLTNVGYQAFEILDDLGYGAARFHLNKKELEIYKSLKEGGNNKHYATPTVKTVIDKVTSTISLPVALTTLAGQLIGHATK